MKSVRCGIGDFVNVDSVHRVRLLKTPEGGQSQVELTFQDGKKRIITGSDAEWTFEAVSTSLINTPPA